MGTYELRHRDHTVLTFQYSPVRKILEIISPERLPVPVENVKDFGLSVSPDTIRKIL